MQVSWNWLSELVDLSGVGGPTGMADLLTSRGLEVEAIERQDQGLEKVVTVQILERNPHPQADRLSLCKVTLGSGAPLEIVCGAQNMKAGDKVALAQIGALLPNGLKIQESKIRGVVSNGMLCSEEELKFKDKSEGILILPPATPLGKPLAEILGRNDTVFTLKLTANRGDCLSHYGLAREIGAAIGKKAKAPEAPALKLSGSPVTVALDAGAAGPQFFGASIDGVKIGPSPEWLVKRLEVLGSRSINNVVDATNLVMLELGHPVHAYDADKIEGGKIQVRLAKEGEVLPLLDGTSVTLAGTELVIADGKRAVGLAGVMGGGNSEVQPNTTRVFLECAEFEPRIVRKASSKHQKKTEAAHRFERGIDPEGLPHAIARLTSLVLQLAGGKFVGGVSARNSKPLMRTISVSAGYFESFLGMPVPAAKAEEVLSALGCTVAKKGDAWTVGVPSYRNDLSIEQDLAEEIARSLGYDQIRETVPPLSGPPRTVATALSSLNRQISRAKDALVQGGLNESLNYAFTSRAWLAKFGLNSSALVVNPLSDEHEALVPSLLPGLIKNCLDNWSRHFGSEPLALRLFELRPTFEAGGPIAAQGEMQTNVRERWKLALALSGPRYAAGMRAELGEVDFYDLKAVAENFFEALGTRGVRYQPLSASRTGGSPLFHPGVSVEILAGKDVAGTLGLTSGQGTRAQVSRAALDRRAGLGGHRRNEPPCGRRRGFQALARVPLDRAGLRFGGQVGRDS